MQFLTSFVSSELPINADRLTIPGKNPGVQRGQHIRDANQPLVEDLPGHDREFYLSHVEPASMLGCVVKFKFSGEAARAANILLAVGVIERDTQFNGGTLYCTLLYFGPDGTLLGKHRKLKPTAAERLIWGEGDGSTLTVVDTELGRIGGLICWENYMPLARMALYGKGMDVYLAPTADSRPTWTSTLQHIALEGRCYVLGCNQYVTKSMYPADLPGIEDLENKPEVMCRGGSAIISPLGEVLAGPLYDQEGILYAEVDPAEVVRARLDFDVVGHYARPDVFQFAVNEQPTLPVDYHGTIQPNPVLPE